MNAQSSPSSASLERLETLGKLWAAVKYFHPRLGYDLALNWDQAILDAVPEVLGNADEGRYRATVERMLDRLEDSATRVVSSRTSEKADTDATPVFEWTTPAILTIRLHALGALQSEAAEPTLAQLKSALTKARAIIFDARAPAWGEPTLSNAALRLEQTGLIGATDAGPLVLPAERRRMHFGYTDDGISKACCMHSGFYTMNGRVITERARPDLRGVVLVDAIAAVPAALYGLRRQGRVMFVGSDGPSDQLLVTTHIIPLAGGLRAQVRLGQLVDTSGPVGNPLDARVPAAHDAHDDTGLAVSVRLLSRRWQMPASPAQPVPALGMATAEIEYRSPSLPDVSHRVLAAVRIWAAINYLYPYKSLLHDDWNGSLRQVLPDFLQAETAIDYHLAIARYVARIRDSHGFVLGPAGKDAFGAVPPLRVRVIEGQPVVVGFRTTSSPICGDPVYWLGCVEEPLPAAGPPGVQVGDVVRSVDGESMDARMARLAPFIAASTPQALQRDLVYRALAGPMGSVARLTLRNDQGLETQLSLARTALDTPMAHMSGGRNGDVYRFVAEGVGYADLTRLQQADVAAMFEHFKDAKAIIFDMRGYPAGSNVYRNLPRDRRLPTGLANLPVASLPTEPSGQWLSQELTLSQLQGVPGGAVLFRGRTVLLIDERAQSYAEGIGLLFKSSTHGAIFVGSNTAGANGVMTSLMVPGGIRVYFSGIGVRHPDGSQLQQVGLRPDHVVRPTIHGIRAGRDEVLERALQLISAGQ